MDFHPTARRMRTDLPRAGILRNQSCHASHVGIAVLAVGDPVHVGRPVPADRRQLCQRLLRRRPRRGRGTRSGVARVARVAGIILVGRTDRHPTRGGRPLGPARRHRGDLHPCTRASGRLRCAAETGVGGGRRGGGARLSVRSGNRRHHRILVAARGRRVLPAGRLVLYRWSASVRIHRSGRVVRVRVLRPGGGVGDPVRAVRNCYRDGGAGRGAGRPALLRAADGQ